ncbi:hypothetical protein HPB51_021340 [Rhipicephalus microplus]|uniref:Uncharacterized protein n=1 Tax=Rhipicephalus microplus TaxID=6941 RepID=A0A9J6F9I3_RHIMP|nr:hypothetical protein HPB51_021340 [Rhipicephalus microplus]
MNQSERESGLSSCTLGVTVTTVKTSLQNEDPPCGGVVIGREVRVTRRISESSSRAGHDLAPAPERCRAPAQIRPLLPSETRRQRTRRKEKKQQKLRKDGTPSLLPSATDTSERLKRRRVGRIAGRLSVHGSAPLNFSSGPPFMARRDGGIAVALASVYHTCALYSSLPHNRPRPAALGCTVHTRHRALLVSRPSVVF